MTAVSCCSLDSIEAARRVAAELGLSALHRRLRGPVRDSRDSPVRARLSSRRERRTPAWNAIAACDFPGLWNRARAWGCEAFATGHYARIERTRTGRTRTPRDGSRQGSELHAVGSAVGDARPRHLSPGWDAQGRCARIGSPGQLAHGVASRQPRDLFRSRRRICRSDRPAREGHG